MRLTIGIATWNRCRLLGQTLESLAHQRVGPDVSWRVVVCDNNSTDQTEAVVASASDRLGVHYTFEREQGKSYALNRLLRESDADWIVFIDDDVRMAPDWLAAYVDGMRRYERASCLGGPILPWIEDRLGRRAAYLLHAYPGAFGILRLDADIPMALPNRTAYGGNMALRVRDVPVEGFELQRGKFGDQRVSGEDVGMIQRILDAGGEGHLLAGAAVEHYMPRQRIGLAWYCQWQMGFGRNLIVQRGRPEPGRFGVPWWAWRELLRRSMWAAMCWRPWPSKTYYDALGEAARYYGYLRTGENVGS